MTRVLIVEDDTGIRTLLHAVLARDGFTVVESGNGAHALQALSVAKFDAVVLDLMMPVLGGQEVLDHLAAEKPFRRNVVVLTAANPAHFGSLNDRCIQTILRKPFDLAEMLAAVRAAAQREVLVVEDNPAHQYLIERELTKGGYAVTVAADGRVALAELRERKYDAMVLDIVLPVVSGYDVVTAIGDDPRRPATVVLTTLDHLDTEIPVDAVLQKPSGFDVLVPTLRTLLP